MAKVMNVDSDLCLRCGLCASMYGDNFELSGVDGSAVVTSQNDIPEDMVDMCPAGAISINEVADEVDFPATNQDVKPDDKAA